ncbi:MAG: TIGR03000 domain-containing protein [Gemmataceae bacterium]|nr:TIGR03000 domain-containing protein [Gemmataceae bacterium]MDW8265971.1 TIGR03000 domain-containing protein [Gemmataceae bacterium]
MRKLAILAAVAAGVVWSADRAEAQCPNGRCGAPFAPRYASNPQGTIVLPTAPIALNDAPATLVVTLPEDAKLFIDDRPTTSTSGTRVFRTPELKRGYEYTYVLRMEVVVDGETKSVTRRAVVRAGEETRVDLQLPVAVAAD